MKISASLALLAALATWGCSSAVLPGHGDDLQASVKELKTRVLELQRQARVSEIELARLRQRVAELEAAAGTGSPQPGDQSGASSELDRQSPGVAEVSPPPPPPPHGAPPSAGTGKPAIEESDLPVESEAAKPQGGSAAEKPAAAPTPSAAGSKAARPAATAPAGASRGEKRPVPAAGQALYDRGYTLFHKGLYVDSEATFQRFLQAYGDTQLADNAQYWIGESRFSRGDLRGALAAFRETIERYPKGNKVPDALLKAGQALEGLKDLEGARASYREIVSRFPNTAAAAVAEERLGRLP